jgi:hypothetical protein
VYGCGVGVMCVYGVWEWCVGVCVWCGLGVWVFVCVV